jgi:hypothetical protein
MHVQGRFRRLTRSQKAEMSSLVMNVPYTKLSITEILLWSEDEQPYLEEIEYNPQQIIIWFVLAVLQHTYLDMRQNWFVP